MISLNFSHAAENRRAGLDTQILGDRSSSLGEESGCPESILALGAFSWH
jgi:hypothetical protein